jgi:hypothetical protein
MATRSPNPHDSGLNFLTAEFQTGLMFVNLAIDAAGDPERRERNRQNAITAYDTIKHFLPRVVDLTSAERDAMHERLCALELAIAGIPE